MILTPDMLREVAKDIHMVATTNLGRINIQGLMMAAAAEIERLEKLGNKIVDTVVAQMVDKHDEPKEPPSEADLAKEMAPSSGKKKSKK